MFHRGYLYIEQSDQSVDLFRCVNIETVFFQYIDSKVLLSVLIQKFDI